MVQNDLIHIPNILYAPLVKPEAHNWRDFDMHTSCNLSITQPKNLYSV